LTISETTLSARRHSMCGRDLFGEPEDVEQTLPELDGLGDAGAGEFVGGEFFHGVPQAAHAVARRAGDDVLKRRGYIDVEIEVIERVMNRRVDHDRHRAAEDVPSAYVGRVGEGRR